VSQSKSDQHAWFFTGVFLTCMCGLMLQIMETRILSVIGYYYLAFFSIGVAMLGMTAGALLVFYKGEQKYEPQALSALMSRLMATFGWSVAASLLVLLSISLGSRPQPTLTFVVSWTLVLLVLLPPYVLLGATISLALTRSTARISLVYGIDLSGAALGCLLTLLLLTATDTYSAVLLVGAIGGAAAYAFQRGARLPASTTAPAPWRTRALRPPVVFAALLVAAGTNHLLGTHGLRPVLVKGAVERPHQLTEERWNSFSRVALRMEPQTEAFMWSPSRAAVRPRIDQGWLNIDGEAGTPIYNYRGDAAAFEFLGYDATAVGYYIRNEGRAAVIGIGGGRDLITAHLFGFRDITGVEYNPIFVRLFSRDYREFSGADKIAGLRLITDDARSWFARSDESFDLIQMSLIDTWAATGAGAFTLSENGLYTVEGWTRFLSRLSPTGIFTVSRWFAPAQADETARILSLAMATLIEMGVDRPSEHLYLIANDNLSTLIVGRSPLTPADLERLDVTVGRLGYRVLAGPGHPTADPTFERILQAGTTRELVEYGSRTQLNLTPTWDSNPFFFNQLHLSDPVSMARAWRASTGTVAGNLVASLTLLTLIFISGVVGAAVLLAPARSSARNVERGALVWSSTYFVLIGVGFMFVELALIQRLSLFLGHPIYGLAVVLFSVILATGIGSLISDFLVPLRRIAAAAWPLALALYLATLPLWLGKVLEASESSPLLARSAVSVAVSAPAGVLMGFMFPLGIRLCGRLDTRITPWLWAVNGAAGVLASGAAILVAIGTSLNHAMWVGAACYSLLVVPAITLLAKGAQRPQLA
jgi:hypothetical protein